MWDLLPIIQREGSETDLACVETLEASNGYTRIHYTVLGSFAIFRNKLKKTFIFITLLFLHK